MQQPVDSHNRHSRTKEAAVPVFTLAELSQRVADLQKINEEIRESRHAALNMMEDAILSKEAWRRSEERYRTIFSSIREGFSLLDIQFDAQGKAVNVLVRDVNPAQNSSDGVVNRPGKPLQEILPDIDIESVERYARIARTGEPEYFEDWSEAGQRWYDVHATRVGGDGSTLIAIVYSDITERKKTEQALQQSEERFRNFVTASSDIVYKMNADWTLMYDLQGKNFLTDTSRSNSVWMENYIPEHEKPNVKKAISEAIRHKKMFELEHQVFTAGGGLAWTYSRAVPALNEAGEIIEWIGAASDITKRKEAESILHENLDKLTHSNNVRTDRETDLEALKGEVNELCRRLDEPERYPGR